MYDEITKLLKSHFPYADIMEIRRLANSIVMLLNSQNNSRAV